MTTNHTTNPPNTHYQINRKAANNVRKKYGGFYRYVKALLNLRKQLQVDRTIDTGNPYYQLSITIREIIDSGALPTGSFVDACAGNRHDAAAMYAFRAREQALYPRHNTQDSLNYALDNSFFFHTAKQALPLPIKPAMQRPNALRPQPDPSQPDQLDKYTEWRENVRAFLEPLADTESNNPNYYPSFLKLVIMTYAGGVRQLPHWLHDWWIVSNEEELNRYLDETVTILPEFMPKTLDELVLKYHSNEVFEPKPVQPTDRYTYSKYQYWVDHYESQHAPF